MVLLLTIITRLYDDDFFRHTLINSRNVAQRSEYTYNYVGTNYQLFNFQLFNFEDVFAISGDVYPTRKKHVKNQSICSNVARRSEWTYKLSIVQLWRFLVIWGKGKLTKKSIYFPVIKKNLLKKYRKITCLLQEYSVLSFCSNLVRDLKIAACQIRKISPTINQPPRGTPLSATVSSRHRPKRSRVNVVKRVRKTSRKYSGSDKVQQRGKRPSCIETRERERERERERGLVRGCRDVEEARVERRAGQPPIKGRTPRAARVAAAIPVYLIWRVLSLYLSLSLSLSFSVLPSLFPRLRNECLRVTSSW